MWNKGAKMIEPPKITDTDKEIRVAVRDGMIIGTLLIIVFIVAMQFL